eukprot:TRINITY_DN30454_c0_g2_i1.p1 TRINITY_DN30454_c0_g2~~TRINITY_DN30454_c0_g2_i1.p1  ORF type:complete len:516 (-),score=157.64 TRINITY_DN30454_c0_g2_i1:47-1594(-)
MTFGQSWDAGDETAEMLSLSQLAATDWLAGNGPNSAAERWWRVADGMCAGSDKAVDRMLVTILMARLKDSLANQRSLTAGLEAAKDLAKAAVSEARRRWSAEHKLEIRRLTDQLQQSRAGVDICTVGRSLRDTLPGSGVPELGTLGEQMDRFVLALTSEVATALAQANVAQSSTNSLQLSWRGVVAEVLFAEFERCAPNEPAAVEQMASAIRATHLPMFSEQQLSRASSRGVLGKEQLLEFLEGQLELCSEPELQRTLSELHRGAARVHGDLIRAKLPTVQERSEWEEERKHLRRMLVAAEDWAADKRNLSDKLQITKEESFQLQEHVAVRWQAERSEFEARIQELTTEKDELRAECEQWRAAEGDSLQLQEHVAVRWQAERAEFEATIAELIEDKMGLERQAQLTEEGLKSLEEEIAAKWQADREQSEGEIAELKREREEHGREKEAWKLSEDQVALRWDTERNEFEEKIVAIETRNRELVAEIEQTKKQLETEEQGARAVSYTHLTLPTKRIV